MTAREFPAITLWQPWASLIFSGDKRHETRSFHVPKRIVGQWCAIHAAKRQPQIGDLTDSLEALVRRRFGDDWPKTLPRGAVLGLVRFAPAVPTERVTHETIADFLSGDFSPGRHAWPVVERHQLAEPVPARGGQGWWKVALEPPAQLGE